MKPCPKCALVNPEGAPRCDCGFDFPSGTTPTSYLTEKEQTARFDWRMQVFNSLLGSMVVFAAIGLLNSDASLFLSIFIDAVLSVSIIFLLIYAAFGKNRRRSFRQLLTLVILWIVATCFFLFDRTHPIAIRSNARWLVSSGDDKAQVLAQPQPPNGELKHVDWDGWGMFAQNTEVYLVYDPADSLQAAALSGQPGKFGGIPCQVLSVRRLESRWYSVIFYTGETWDHCN
jgi:hypothetical protein